MSSSLKWLIRGSVEIPDIYIDSHKGNRGKRVHRRNHTLGENGFNISTGYSSIFASLDQFLMEKN